MRALLPFVILIVGTVIFFSDILFGPDIYLDANPFHYSPWQAYALESDLQHTTYRTDSFVTYLPRRYELTRSIREGRFPLWNPYIFGGMPFFADPQTRVLYPPALLLAAFDPLRSMGYDVAIHVCLAMIGMFLFMRAVRVSVAGSIAAAFGYAFCSFFYVRIGHPTFVATGAWVPFFFYGFEKSRRGEKKGIILLSLFFILGYFAGFPQVFIFGVGSVLIYGFYVNLFEGGLTSKWRNLTHTAKIFAISGGLAILVVAVQLVPFIELSRNSTGLLIELDYMKEIFITPPALLLRSIFPNLFGNPVEGTDWSDLPREAIHPYNPDFTVYCGIGVLMLAAIALWRVKRNPRIQILSVLLLASIAIATSPYAIEIAYRLLPVFRASRISRIAVISCLCLSALGGIGFDYVRDAAKDRKLRKYIIGVVAGVIGFALAFAVFSAIRGETILARFAEKTHSIPETMWLKLRSYTRSGLIKEWSDGNLDGWLAYETKQVIRGIVFAVIAGSLLLVAALAKPVKGRLRIALSAILVGFIFFDIGLTAKNYFVTQVPDCLFETRGIKFLKDKLSPPGRWRLVSSKRGAEDVRVLPPNTNQIFGLCSLMGQSTILPQGYAELAEPQKPFIIPAPLLDRKAPYAQVFVVATNMGCVRYVLLPKGGKVFVSNPILGIIGSLDEVAEYVRLFRLGGDTRAAFCQPHDHELNVRIQVPPVKYLDVAFGFNSEGASPGDTLAFGITCQRGEVIKSFTGKLDLYRDGGRWHEFRIDISEISGGKMYLKLGWVITKSRSEVRVNAGWSDFDFVYADCNFEEIDGGYIIPVRRPHKSLKLYLKSACRELPLEVWFSRSHRRIWWILFGDQFRQRAVTVDISEAHGKGVVIGSDSSFALARVKLVDTDPLYQGLDLVYDRDMFVYENHLAVPKGICVDPDLVELTEDGRVKMRAMDSYADLTCGTCEIVSYEPEEIKLRVDAERDCILIFQDVSYPGWRVLVDGVEQSIRATDVGMRAIDIPRGVHTVRMIYDPASLKIGLALSLAGLGLMTIYGFRGRRVEGLSDW